MIYSAAIWFDFAGSLAIIFVLTIAYGHIHRWHFSREQGRMLLGLGFGLVAWLQMNMPLEPMDGLIIDLRNVPLVLCGAFLGWRASLICFCVAAATRFGIGGVGMWSGILAMTIAVSVGGLWAHITRAYPQRKLKHMVLLGCLASLHLSAAVVLSEPAQTWFLENASVPIAIFNLVSITISAHLLDAEERKISREDRLAACATLDPDHGAMTKPSFEREIALRVSSGQMAPPAGLLLVRLKYADMLFSFVPASWRGTVLGLVRKRIFEEFDNADLAFSLGSTALGFPLTKEQMANDVELQAGITRLMNAEPFQVGADGLKFLAVETKVVSWNAEASLDTILNSARKNLKRQTYKPFWHLKQDTAQIRQVQEDPKTSQTLHQDISMPLTEALFGKAAFLMKTGR